MLSLSEKIQAIKRVSGMSIVGIADTIGYQKESVYKWSTGTRPSEPDIYQKIDELWKKTVIKDPVQTLGNVTSNCHPSLVNEPLPELLTFAEVFNLPVTKIITVTDDDFEPLFKKGCKLFLTKVKDTRLLVWGLVYYFIDKNGWTTLRKVSPGDNANTIRLCSDNEKKYPAMLRQIDDFAEVFAVVGILILP